MMQVGVQDERHAKRFEGDHHPAGRPLASRFLAPEVLLDTGMTVASGIDRLRGTWECEKRVALQVHSSSGWGFHLGIHGRGCGIGSFAGSAHP
jgi:hypothetical protein